MLTVDEVEALLEEHAYNLDDFEDNYGDPWEFWNEVAGGYANSKTVEVVGLGQVTVTEQDFGGIETNTAYLLFGVGNRIFRKEGLWVSHWGMNWDYDFTEVKPVQKIVTDYEVI